MTLQIAQDIISTTTASVGTTLGGLMPYAIPTLVILGILFWLFKKFV